jgi:hypothetical protein
MKAYVQWRCISTILNFDTKWRWVISFKPLPLYHRWSSPRYPLCRRLNGPHSISGYYGEHLFTLSRIKPQLLGFQFRSLVAKHTQIFKLLVSIETCTYGLYGEKNMHAISAQKCAFVTAGRRTLFLFWFLAHGVIQWAKCCSWSTAEPPVTGWSETCKQIHCKLMTIACYRPRTLFRN